jgi:uncharacterized protein YeaO (DUF488 family)
MHDAQHHISFAKYIGNIHVVRVSTPMDDAIHVEIQMVKLWQQRGIRNNLIDFWIALANPAIELQCYKTNENKASNVRKLFSNTRLAPYLLQVHR